MHHDIIMVSGGVIYLQYFYRPILIPPKLPRILVKMKKPLSRTQVVKVSLSHLISLDLMVSPDLNLDLILAHFTINWIFNLPKLEKVRNHPK